MYDRAPRNITVPGGSTVEHVGPGTYDLEIQNPKKTKADGYAPFSSMTSRESFLNPNDTVIAAPGPGQYDPEFPQEVVKGGRTLANRSNRFGESSTFTPGPGAYSLSKKTDWLKEVGGPNANSAPSGLESRQDTKGQLVMSRIKFHRKPVAPSIPTPGQAYGFEENEDGSLRKQDAPNKDNSLGPAFYNPQEPKPKPTVQYNGIHFGKMTSKRMDFGGKDGPGPGEYEAYIPANSKAENVNIHEEDKNKFESRLPRYHELVVKDVEKKAIPGPGQYDVRGEFDPKPAKVNTEGIEVEHPPFLSQSKRFTGKKIETPAPGAYNDPRTALEATKKITGLKRSPFSQTSVRFQGDHHSKTTPGPGAYNSRGMGSASMKKAYIESTRRGGFGSTAIRIQPMTKRNDVEQPGPAHYQVKDKVNEPRFQQLSSNFASLSTRLSEPPPIVKEIPPPGSYEVHRSFRKSQGKKSPKAPRTQAAKQKQGAFKSSASRFAPPRDVIIGETDPYNPGPGAYNPANKDSVGNMIVVRDERFRAPAKDDLPGPGAYEFSPLMQDTVLKGTFNATLNNPVAPQMQALRVGSTANHPFLLGV